jgi:S-adenosylmethionine synthetase
VRLYPMVSECNVSMVSQIGRRIDDPKSVYIDLIMAKGEKLESVRTKLNDIAQETLNNLAYITQEISMGKYEMF